MAFPVMIIAFCLTIGLAATVLAARPQLFAELGEGLRGAKTMKKFSPRNALFVIGPDFRHGACRLQRRLLKPALPAFIGADIDIIELYGDDAPKKNGVPMEWLDPSLMRHALGAERGFFLIFVDEHGKTTLKKESPAPTSDLLKSAKLTLRKTPRTEGRVSRKLRTA